MESIIKEIFWRLVDKKCFKVYFKEKSMRKIIEKIYHSVISWRSVTKFGNDFFIEINNESYSLIMLKPNQLSRDKLIEIKNTYKDFCTYEENLKLLEKLKFSGKLKNSFVLFLSNEDKLLCLCHNYSQGFEKVSDYDKIYFMNQKKMNTGFKNNFFYLKKVTFQKT